MSVGGKRAGSGRKKGGANLKTREIADRAAREGITPLEVMLKAMREAHDLAITLPPGPDRVTAMTGAAALAKDAAPYCHPRLQAVEHSGPNGGPVQLSYLEWNRQQDLTDPIPPELEA